MEALLIKKIHTIDNGEHLLVNITTGDGRKITAYEGESAPLAGIRMDAYVGETLVNLEDTIKFHCHNFYQRFRKK